jgi:RNA-splicing ligase RtcB
MHVDVPKGLEFLPIEYGGGEYLHDMKVAQRFALLNRKLINDILWPATRACLISPIIESVHNYIDPSMMIRKGAISAMAGEPLVIPLNMRDGVIIGTGKGNSLWNNSAPHGAGRVMSRMQAKRELTMDSFAESMAGVYSSCLSADTLDEAPAAYKAPGVIIGAIGDTVDIQAVLTPVYNFKAEA